MHASGEKVWSLSPYQTVWLGLAFAICLDTVTQLCWKSAVAGVPETLGVWASIGQVLSVPLFHLTLLLFLLQFVNWIVVLAHADLSYAQPITALSYITVSVSSVLLFRERLSLLRVAGLALILLGVWFISRTSHRTTTTQVSRPHSRLSPEELS
jgi:drug/metabolite transporter (DMT)-like permease